MRLHGRKESTSELYAVECPVNPHRPLVGSVILLYFGAGGEIRPDMENKDTFFFLHI